MMWLLIVAMIVLVAEFPPGTTWGWQVGRVRLVFPIGWCLLATLVLTLIGSLWGKSR
jgi:hypothetical protein